MIKTTIALFAPLLVCSFVFPSDCSAQSTGYYPYTIARPQDRAWIRSLPIELRPNRPLHFYGNFVRQSSSVGANGYAARRPLPISRPMPISRPVVRYRPAPATRYTSRPINRMR